MAVFLRAATSFAADGAFDASDVPRALRPPTLPEITHPDVEADVETTAGTLLPHSGEAAAHVVVQRLGVEAPVAGRRWYVGAEYEAAAGTAGHGAQVVGANAAIGGRTLWATRAGLAFGGGLQLVLPATAFDATGSSAAVALEAASLRPWDVSVFQPSALGARPFVDVRVLDGPFAVQFREGLDATWSIGAGGSERLYAMTGVYVGWRISARVAAGVEILQAYAIDVPGVHDGARSAIVASPSVRLSLPWVEPSIAAIASVGTTLHGAYASVWGFRVGVTLVYDARAHRVALRAGD